MWAIKEASLSIKEDMNLAPFAGRNGIGREGNLSADTSWFYSFDDKT